MGLGGGLRAAFYGDWDGRSFLSTPLQMGGFECGMVGAVRDGMEWNIAWTGKAKRISKKCIIDRKNRAELCCCEIDTAQDVCCVLLFVVGGGCL